MNTLFRISFLVNVIFIVMGSPSNGQQAAGKSFKIADSFYLVQDYNKAKALYTHLLGDTSHDAFHLNRLGYSEYCTGGFNLAEKHYKRSLASNPALPVKASALSRLARIYAIQNRDVEAIVLIDSAISAGYLAINELDTIRDFNRIRTTPPFKQVRNKLYSILYPCMNDRHAREFDFWIGEWDVYATGTDTWVGNSIIQRISGGCAILENWTSSVSEGKSLNFVDDSSNKWKQVWVGSYPGGKQDFYNGEYTDSAMRFTYESKNAQGNTIKGRFTFFNLDPNTVRQLNEASADQGQSWQTNYDFTYRRKNK